MFSRRFGCGFLLVIALAACMFFFHLEINPLMNFQPVMGGKMPYRFLVIGRNAAGKYHFCALSRASAASRGSADDAEAENGPGNCPLDILNDVEDVDADAEASLGAAIRQDEIEQVKRDLRSALGEPWPALEKLQVTPLTTSKVQVELVLRSDDYSATYVYVAEKDGVCPVAYRELGPPLMRPAGECALRDTLWFLLVVLTPFCGLVSVGRLSRRAKAGKGSTPVAKD